MSTLISLLLLLVFLGAGFVAARLRLLSFNRVVGVLFSVFLYLLLFSMGLRLGQSREVLASLPLVGALAVCGTLFASLGTVGLHALLTPLYRKLDGSPSVAIAGSERGTDRHETERPGAPRRGAGFPIALLLHNLKKPLILLVLVVVGAGVGYVMPRVDLIADGTIATWILYLLLFIIGVQMAAGGVSLRELLMRPVVLVVPLVTVAGTLVGSLGTLVFGGMTVGKALALGSGFGWYSLSGVLIANLGDPALGTAAFLSNLLRESLAFVMIPLLRLTGRCESGIGIAGATSMDVTLPVIEDAWGPARIPLAVAHGVILSFLVPVLVPLFMAL